MTDSDEQNQCSCNRPQGLPTSFDEWFDSNFLDPDGGSSHLPDWFKTDMRGAWDAALSRSQSESVATSIDPETIIKIDHLLAREEHDSGYSAFVFMRKIWPQLRTLALSRPQGNTP